MLTALMILQLLLGIALIVVITLQSSKGEGLGSIGGSAQMFFTPQKGLEVFLNKATTVLAVLFVVAALVIDYMMRL